MSNRSFSEALRSSVAEAAATRCCLGFLLTSCRLSAAFSHFKEISDLMISAIQFGMTIDQHTMPDGSVGIMWAKHWNSNGLAQRHGERARHPHLFPDYWAQAAAEIECWVYPLPALGDFKVWLQEVYLPEKYPAYIAKKTREGAIDASRATLLLSALSSGATDEKGEEWKE